MRSLLIEEKNKTPQELIEKALMKVWPKVYAIINGLVNILTTTIVRILQIILEQLGFK